MTPPSTAYTIQGRKLAPRLQDIARSGADAIVNSIGARASFRNPIARAILAACGEGIRDELAAHTPVRSGQVAVTGAGRLAGTRYVFHAVATSQAAGYKADPAYIDRITRRCIGLADLLDLESLALPAFGTGMGRAGREVVVRTMIAAALDSLPRCQSLQLLVFATTDPETFHHYHTHIVFPLVLEEHARQVAALLPRLPPGLYGAVGQLLQRLDALRRQALAGTDLAAAEAQATALQQEAAAMVRAAQELEQALPEAGQMQAVSVIIATGGSIVENVSVAIAQGRSVAGGPGSVNVGGDVYGDVRAER